MDLKRRYSEIPGFAVGKIHAEKVRTGVTLNQALSSQLLLAMCKGRKQMTDISEDDIRKRAYAVWEAAGCPDGSHEEHWLEALRQLKEEAATGIPQKTARTSKLSVVKNDPVAAPAPKKRTRIV